MFNQLFNRGPMYSSFGSPMGSVLKKGFSWSGLLNGTQKTLNIINQAIPVFYQVKPIWNNAKTMFRIIGEMGKINANNNNNRDSKSNTNTTTVNNQTDKAGNAPKFFI
jgi:hypothetical protein